MEVSEQVYYKRNKSDWQCLIGGAIEAKVFRTHRYERLFVMTHNLKFAVKTVFPGFERGLVTGLQDVKMLSAYSL